MFWPHNTHIHLPSTLSSKRWVINISGEHLSDSEMSLLQKGMKFAISPSNLRIIITPIEQAVQKLLPHTADFVRMSVFTALKMNKLPCLNITPSEREALQALRKRENLILPADKGRSTVLLTKIEYKRKAYDILQGDQTFYSMTHSNLREMSHSFTSRHKKKSWSPPESLLVYSPIRQQDPILL